MQRFHSKLCGEYLRSASISVDSAQSVTMALESIRYNDGKLEVLDQLLLPAQNKYISVKGVEDGWKVINRMQVRGAPAIAIVGCLSLAVEIIRDDFADKKTLRQDIEGKLNYLVSARPTAVNVSKVRNVGGQFLSFFCPSEIALFSHFLS